MGSSEQNSPGSLYNFQLLFGTGQPEYIPFTFDIGAIPGFTRPVLERFRLETGSERPEEYFDYDFRTFSLRSRFGGSQFPGHRNGGEDAGTTFDEWGIGHWAGGAEATYEKIISPLARARTVREVEEYPVPVVEEVNAAGVVEGYRERGYPVFGYAGSIYEWSWWLRGMEQFMTDLLLSPSIAGAIVEKVTSHTLNLARRSAEAGIDVLCFYDDVGMQSGMQISPALWRAYIKPSWRRVLGEVREKHPSVRCYLHSCGNIRAIVPDIVELGFDILHPLQPECMDLGAIEKEFGAAIVLCSTVSAQRTFPFGTPEEVRREVRRLKGIFRESRRTILCPSNAVQPETPWENVVAFAEEARAARPARG